MSSLNKVSRLTMRLTPDQLKRIRAATAISARKRKERLEPSVLVRELVMPQVDAIIAEAGERTDDKDEDGAVRVAA